MEYPNLSIKTVKDVKVINYKSTPPPKKNPGICESTPTDNTEDNNAPVKSTNIKYIPTSSQINNYSTKA